jgi:hypothetical protein
MGNVIWIDIRDRPGSETHNDLGVPLELDKQLDVLAEKLGVAKITSFYDYRELIKALGDDQEELPEPVWFDSNVGLATFKALRVCLEANWDALEWTPDKSQQHWPQSLMDDLRFCQSVLEEAVLKGQAFRLLIVP